MSKVLNLSDAEAEALTAILKELVKHWEYMPVQRMCKLCGRSIIVWNTLQNKCKGCTLKTAKKIPVKGKRAKEYETWRDVMAIPYLDKKYGLACSKCKVMPAKKEDGTYYRHDIDHIKNRSTHPQLKLSVTNIRYLCRNCHVSKGGRSE